MRSALAFESKCFGDTAESDAWQQQQRDTFDGKKIGIG